MPSSQRPHSFLRVGSLTGAVILTATLVTGCATGVAPAALPEAAELSLHPVGDEGHWFHDRYAAGVEYAYATPNVVCGIAGNIVVEVQTGPAYGSSVLARYLPRGEVAWEMDDARCEAGSVTDGSVVVSASTGDMRETSLVDAVTGTQAADLALKGERADVGLVTRVGDQFVLTRGGEALIGLRNGVEEWSVPLPPGAEPTALDDGFIGILDGLGDQLMVVDGKTGEIVLNRAVERPDWITWASDGYVQKINESDPEYAFFDLTGAEVDRTLKEAQYRFTPSPNDGITFPIADHIAAGRVVGVSASGVPSLFQDEHQKNFTQAGEVTELPDSIIMLQAVSQDGSLLFFTAPDDTMTMIDSTGKQIFNWPGRVSDLRVESGYIVVTTGTTTQVLLPAE